MTEVAQVSRRLRILRAKLKNPNLSRQRRWQLRRIIDGKCEICGGKREDNRQALTRCLKCERKRHEKPAPRETKAERTEREKNRRPPHRGPVFVPLDSKRIKEIEAQSAQRFFQTGYESGEE